MGQSVYDLFVCPGTHTQTNITGGQPLIAWQKETPFHTYGMPGIMNLCVKSFKLSILFVHVLQGVLCKKHCPHRQLILSQFSRWWQCPGPLGVPGFDSTEFSPSLLLFSMSIKQEFPDPILNWNHVISLVYRTARQDLTRFNTKTSLSGFFSCCFGLVIPADGPPGSTNHIQCPQSVGKRLAQFTLSRSNSIAERMWTMWKNNHHPNENKVPCTNAWLAISVM